LSFPDAPTSDLCRRGGRCFSSAMILFFNILWEITGCGQRFFKGSSRTKRQATETFHPTVHLWILKREFSVQK
jgi:hypothetical protein